MFGLFFKHLSVTQRMNNCCVKYNISLTEGKDGVLPVSLWLTLTHTHIFNIYKMIKLRSQKPDWMNSPRSCTPDLTLLTIILPPLNSSPEFHPAGGTLLGAAGCQRRDQRPGSTAGLHTLRLIHKHSYKGTYRRRRMQTEEYHMKVQLWLRLRATERRRNTLIPHRDV